MKTRYVATAALALVALAAAAVAQCPVENLQAPQRPAEKNDGTMPSGLVVKTARMYSNRCWDKEEIEKHGEWADTGGSFRHGNASLAVDVKNPTDSVQSLRAEVTLSTGSSRGIFSASDAKLTYIAAAAFAPGTDTAWRIPLPFTSDLRQQWNDYCGIMLDDSLGKLKIPHWAQIAATWSGYIYEMYEEVLNRGGRCDIECRQSHLNFAMSLAFGDGKEIREGIAAALKSQGEAAPISLVSPDFRQFTRWQELAVYDVIIVAEEDVAKLGGDFAQMLSDYAAAGGTLVKIGLGGQTMDWGLGRICAYATASDIDFAHLADDAEKTYCMFNHAAKDKSLYCDSMAWEKLDKLRSATPFLLLTGVLLLFSTIAGPIAIATLARKNKRINILWLFPVMAVAFSIAVGVVIVLVNGIDPELYQYAFTIRDERAGKAVTVQHDVILAPFPLKGAIIYPADALVNYFSGSNRDAGATILYDGASFAFLDGWAPPLWPVAFRTITVRDIATDDEDLVTLPIPTRLQLRDVNGKVERRAAK